MMVDVGGEIVDLFDSEGEEEGSSAESEEED
jgi:hypothetical protein